MLQDNLAKSSGFLYGWNFFHVTRHWGFSWVQVVWSAGCGHSVSPIPFQFVFLILLSHALTLVVEFRNSMGSLYVCLPNVNLLAFLLIGEEDALSHLTKYHSAFDEADEIGWLPLHKAAVQLNKNILEITLKGNLFILLDASRNKF